MKNNSKIEKLLAENKKLRAKSSLLKNAAEKLKESEYFFKKSQEAANIGSYKFDLKTGKWSSSKVLDKIFAINEKYKKDLKSWLKIVYKDDKKMMEDYFKNEVLGKHQSFNKEYRISTKSSSGIKWVHGLGKLFFDDKNKVISMIGTIQDITERKKIEDNLKIAEQKFRRLFEAAKDSILILDADTGEITDSNPFIQDLLGYSAKELIGKKIYEISPFKDIIENKEKFIELKEKGYVYYDNLPLRAKSGAIKQVEFVSNAYLVAGKKVIQCNIRNITERIKKEKELEIAKNEFISITSHQFRTPLSATKWVLETLFSDSTPTLKQKEKFNYLTISNNRLIKLVNNMLSVSRIEAGKMAVNKEFIDIQNIVDALKASVKNISNKYNKKIIFKLDPKIKSVYCDLLIIHEILENLLTNAIEYSNKNSEIIFKIKERKDDYLVSIYNDGYIKAESAKKIKNFGKFVRGIGSSEIEPAGSGLGLYICKKLIEASGGTIWFESDSKLGTTFYVTIIKNKTDKLYGK